MPNYEVTIKETRTYAIPISADNRDEAVDKAWEAMDCEDGGAKYFVDEDGESSCVEVK